MKGKKETFKKRKTLQEEMPTEDLVLKSTSYINRKTKQQRAKEKVEKKKVCLFVTLLAIYAFDLWIHG